MITFDTLQITSFAGVREREISFAPGLNILRGDNESGKSTALSCLRWILYGYGSTAEKKRQLPLDGALPEAALTLTKDGEHFRILRRTAGSGKEKVQIVRASDGTEVGDGRDPGEFFFGLPSDAFDQSALIRQGDISVDGKKMSQAMNNLLFSADESVSVENAVKHLNKARIALWHLNRKGGRIAEQSDRLQTLRARLSEASASASEDMELETAIASKKETLLSHKKRAEEFRLQLLAYRVLRRKEKEALLEERLRAWETSEAGFRAARDGGIESGFVPSEEYRTALLRAEVALREAGKRVESAAAEYAAASAPGTSAEDEAIARFQTHGGVEETLEKCRSGLKKSRRLTVLGAVFFLFIIGIVLLILAVREKRRAEKILADFSCKTLSELEALAERCASRHRLTKERLKNLQAALSDAQLHRDDMQRRARTLANRAGGELGWVLEQISRYDERLQSLSARARECRTAYESTRALLSHEEPIDQIEAELPEIPEDFDPAEINRKLRFYTEQIPLLENQLQQYRLRLTELRATRDDPAALADEIAEGEKELYDLRSEYDSLELAITCLEEASAGLRDTVSGQIAAYAAEDLSRMTGGRFSVLGMDAELALHTVHPDQNGMTVTPAHLSEGTRNQAYLALRLALTRVLCPSDPPPLLMDEALVYLDDTRLGQVLRMLEEGKAERQVLLWTASTREERILSSMRGE